MTNPFLQQKIDEIKGTLSGLSAGNLNDLMESTRRKFDEQLTGEDRNHYLDLFRSIHEEAARRNPSMQGKMRPLEINAELQAEINGMDTDALAASVKESQATVFGTDFIERNSPAYRSEYAKLTALNIEKVRRQEEEAQQANAGAPIL